MTTTDHTDHPSAVYIGEYLTPAEMREQQQRADQRRNRVTREGPHLSRRQVPSTTAPTRASKPPQPKLTPRTCPECSATFVPTSTRNTYCTRRCQQKASKRNYEERIRSRRVDVTCCQCGTTFTTVPRGKNTTRTCSRSCASRMRWNTYFDNKQRREVA